MGSRPFEVLAARQGAVSKSEERLRQATRVSELGVFDHDHLSGELYWSPKQREIFGFEPEEVTTLAAFMETVYPADLAQVQEAVLRAHAPDGDGRFDIEHRIVRRDGQIRWVLTRSQTFFGGDAKARRPLRTVGALVDITDRKIADEERSRAEESLRSNERRFRALIEKNQELIGLTDEHGTIVFVSPAVVNVLGYSSEELLGTSAIALVHASERDEVSGKLAAAASEPENEASFVVRLRHQNGTFRHLDVHVRNLLGEPAVQAIVVNARDITDKLQLEERYREAQKLDSIGRLAGGVAHDFNNMLTAILGYAELLEQGLAGGRPVQRDLHEIVRAAEHARDLTRQLLAFARKQVVVPKVVSLGDVVTRSEGFLRRVLGESVELTVVAEDQLAPVVVDPAQVEQVVMNLALNARDAMPAGGGITIRIANAVLANESEAVAAGVEPGAYVVISVADEGEGIPAEDMPYLFEPFFTTKPVGRGTGLGLATVYGIVCQSGGHIRVRSEPGIGTTFTIYFPRSKHEQLEAVPERDRSMEARRVGHERVLVVEDDPFVRGFVVRTLHEAGYQVSAAQHPIEAMDAVREQALEPDLLLTDIVMPGISGAELARRLAVEHPRMRVLYMSGHAERAGADSGAVESSGNLLAKPFGAAELRSRIRQILDAER